MNYRHAYHAGNFADVLKHSILTLAIEYLKRKDAPFRVIDTHAGIGLYDLSSEEAARTGEWREGIGRLLAEPATIEAAPLLAPYLAAVRAYSGNGGIGQYPGSPLVARALLRPIDRLVANELHPEDHQALLKLFARDRQVKVLNLDGWIAVKSLLPPPERRAIVLIDPPFEVPGEFDRMKTALSEGLKRFASGIFLLWYPIKALRPVTAFRDGVAALAVGGPLNRAIDVELMLRAPVDETRLNGCGVTIVNPPYTLAGELEVLLPFLASRLGEDGSTVRIRTLA